MQKKYIFVMVSLIITCIVAFFCLESNNLTLDSGFDSSYSDGSFGGGSYSGGSSWSSSSSWNSSSSSSGDIVLTGPGVILAIAIFIVILVLFSFLGKQDKQIMQQTSFTYTPLSDDELQKLLPGISRQELIDQVFDIYVKIQKAWMDFDENALRENTTDTMYNMYAMQLDTLKLKNERNMMEQMTLVKADVLEVSKENGYDAVKMLLIVNTKDYIINTKTNEVVRGIRDQILQYTYEITLLRKENDITKCPNCGADLTGNDGTVCEYCKATIVKGSNQWVMSKKEMKQQWRV